MLLVLDRRTTGTRSVAALAVLFVACESSEPTGVGTWEPMADGGEATAEVSADAFDFADGKLFVWGAHWSRGFVYDVASNAWKTVAPGPDPRLGASVFWANGKVLLYGDHAPGYVYDANADAWTPMSTASAPLPHQHASAAWTGTELVVWGGEAADPILGPQSDGGLYDPAKDAWTPMNLANAPSPRTRPVTVWTGAKMLVWGGQDAHGVVLGDGAAFDPATNTWSAIATADAPEPRYFHVAVWTGVEMFVFGGTDGATVFGDGGAYNPAANAWRVISPKDAPLPRLQATAVWNGHEVIVWSGSTRDSGARWEPTRDAWTRMSSVGAPSGRSLAFSFWTGDRFGVFGGDPELHDGGFYRP